MQVIPCPRCDRPLRLEITKAVRAQCPECQVIFQVSPKASANSNSGEQLKFIVQVISDPANSSPANSSPGSSESNLPKSSSGNPPTESPGKRANPPSSKHVVSLKSNSDQSAQENRNINSSKKGDAVSGENSSNRRNLQESPVKNSLSAPNLFPDEEDDLDDFPRNRDNRKKGESSSSRTKSFLDNDRNAGQRNRDHDEDEYDRKNYDDYDDYDDDYDDDYYEDDYYDDYDQNRSRKGSDRNKADRSEFLSEEEKRRQEVRQYKQQKFLDEVTAGKKKIPPTYQFGKYALHALYASIISSLISSILMDVLLFIDLLETQKNPYPLYAFSAIFNLATVLLAIAGAGLGLAGPARKNRQYIYAGILLGVSILHLLVMITRSPKYFITPVGFDTKQMDLMIQMDALRNIKEGQSKNPKSFQKESNSPLQQLWESRITQSTSNRFLVHFVPQAGLATVVGQQYYFSSLERGNPYGNFELKPEYSKNLRESNFIIPPLASNLPLLNTYFVLLELAQVIALILYTASMCRLVNDTSKSVSFISMTVILFVVVICEIIFGIFFQSFYEDAALSNSTSDQKLGEIRRKRLFFIIAIMPVLTSILYTVFFGIALKLVNKLREVYGNATGLKMYLSNPHRNALPSQRFDDYKASQPNEKKKTLKSLDVQLRIGKISFWLIAAGGLLGVIALLGQFAMSSWIAFGNSARPSLFYGIIGVCNLFFWILSLIGTALALVVPTNNKNSVKIGTIISLGLQFFCVVLMINLRDNKLWTVHPNDSLCATKMGLYIPFMNELDRYTLLMKLEEDYQSLRKNVAPNQDDSRNFYQKFDRDPIFTIIITEIIHLCAVLVVIMGFAKYFGDASSYKMGIIAIICILSVNIIAAAWGYGLPAIRKLALESDFESPSSVLDPDGEIDTMKRAGRSLASLEQKLKFEGSKLSEAILDSVIAFINFFSFVLMGYGAWAIALDFQKRDKLLLGIQSARAGPISDEE